MNTLNPRSVIPWLESVSNSAGGIREPIFSTALQACPVEGNGGAAKLKYTSLVTRDQNQGLLSFPRQLSKYAALYCMASIIACIVPG
jgi:hypothetical protein